VTLEEQVKEFQGRTVFITGADGFMGSHLTEALVGAGARVHVFVRVGSGRHLKHLGHLRDRLTIHWGDLTDHHSVATALEALRGAQDRPFIFHLAAQPHVVDSWERPYETVAVNILGTLHLLQGVVDMGLELQKFFLAGSSTEYDARVQANRQTLGVEAPLRPQSIYGSTKAASEFLAINFFEAYGVPTIVARMFNHYGPRQQPRYITGTVIAQALTGPVVKLGSLTPRRDFSFCLDGVSAYVAMALRGEPGEVYTYGQGVSCSMEEWARLILSIGQEEGFWAHREIVSDAQRVRPSHSEVTDLSADSSKLRHDTGWGPTFSWEEGLRQTIRWYGDHRAWWEGLLEWR